MILITRLSSQEYNYIQILIDILNHFQCFQMLIKLIEEYQNGNMNSNNRLWVILCMVNHMVSWDVTQLKRIVTRVEFMNM